MTTTSRQWCLTINGTEHHTDDMPDWERIAARASAREDYALLEEREITTTSVETLRRIGLTGYVEIGDGLRVSPWRTVATWVRWWEAQGPTPERRRAHERTHIAATLKA